MYIVQLTHAGEHGLYSSPGDWLPDLDSIRDANLVGCTGTVIARGTRERCESRYLELTGRA